MGGGIMWRNPNAALWNNPAAQATNEALTELANLRYQNYVALQSMAARHELTCMSKMNHRANLGPFLSVDGLDSKMSRPHWKRPGLGLRSA